LAGLASNKVLIRNMFQRFFEMKRLHLHQNILYLLYDTLN